MITAHYYDGLSTRCHDVSMVIHKGVIAIRGEGIQRSIRLSKLQISENLQHAPRILAFPDGAVLHTRDSSVNKLLRKNGYKEPRVVRWQQNWYQALGALVTLVIVAISSYQWGLPLAADTIAQHLPRTLEQQIGDAELKQVDASYMSPSRLNATDKQRLQQLFAAMAQPRNEKSAYRLEFRHSQIGANAFALPNGVIIMTDELVMLARDDQAIMGVLAHEIGHVQRRHMLRHMFQTAGVGLLLNAFIGDFSSVLATVPAFFLDQKYSRNFETEADQYAIDMMHANGQAVAPLADILEKMAATRANPNDDGQQENTPQAKNPDEDEDGNKAPRTAKRSAAPPEYFSTHPSDTSRIAMLRAADAAWKPSAAATSPPVVTTPATTTP